MAYYPRLTNAQRAERQVQAYELRLKGHSLRAIGKIMGLSHEVVREIISDECNLRVMPLADEVRKQEIDRFDQWLVALNGKIDAGDQVARNIEVAVKVSERRAKLLGADAPVQTEITATVEQRPEVLDLIAQAKVEQAAQEAVIRGE
ncbi:MAG: hypothetical protein ACRDQG_18300 [Pseudonocardiaceae bacterium]